MKMILVRGLPGSGKSTFAKKFGIFHIEQDMFCMKDLEYKWEASLVKTRAYMCKQFAEKAIESKMDLVISNTFTRIWEMNDYIEMAKQAGYELVVYKMCSDYGNTHGVPEESLKAMKERWEDYAGEIEVK